MKNYDTVKLVEMWNQDSPISEISKTVGITALTVRSYAKAHPDLCKPRDNAKFSHKKYDKVLLAKLWNQNKSTKEIAEILGITTTTVRDYAKAHPELCKPRPKVITVKYDEQKLVEMWNSDEPTREIAKVLGISIDMVNYYAQNHSDVCKKRNIRTRSFNENRLIQMWQLNISTQEIANELGISIHTVRRYVQTHRDQCEVKIGKYDKDRLETMWNCNCSVAEIAKELNISQATVRGYAQRFPDKCPKRGRYLQRVKDFDKDKLSQLWETNLTLKEIAKELGISEYMLTKYARAYLPKRRSKAKVIDEEKLKYLWENNATMKEMTVALGIGIYQIKKYVREHDLKRADKYDKVKLAHMWNNDVSIKNIAKEMGASASSILYRVALNPDLCKPKEERKKVSNKKDYDRDLLIKMVNQGKTVKEISKVLDISETTARRYISNDLGISYTQKRKKTQKKHIKKGRTKFDKVIILYKQNMSIKQIAEELMFPEDYVLYCIRLYNQYNE